MEIKIDCELLGKQIDFLDLCSGIMTDEYKKELFEGVANLLSEICFAVEEDIHISFKRVN